MLTLTDVCFSCFPQVSGVGTRRVSTEGSAEQLPNAYFLLPQVQSIQLSQTQVIITELL